MSVCMVIYLIAKVNNAMNGSTTFESENKRDGLKIQSAVLQWDKCTSLFNSRTSYKLKKLSNYMTNTVQNIFEER